MSSINTNTVKSLKDNNLSNSIIMAEEYYASLISKMEQSDEVSEEHHEQCCDNKQIIYDSFMNICKNCGRVDEILNKVSDPAESIGKNGDPLLPEKNMRTFLTGGKNTKANRFLKRMTVWQGHNYMVCELEKAFVLIEKIMGELGIKDNKILNFAKGVYNEIYRNKDFKTSKGKIRTAVYIYCITFAMDHYEIEYNLINILKDMGITIKKYNYAMDRFEIERTYLHENIEEYCEKINDYITIPINDIVKEYNIHLRYKKKTNFKCYENTILIGILFNLIKKKLKKSKFRKLFKISSVSLNKVLAFIEQSDSEANSECSSDIELGQ